MIGNHQNPQNYPSLLLGGTVDDRSTDTRVHAGNVVMKLSHQQHYEEHAFRFECAMGVSFVADEICEDFFTQSKKRVCDTAAVLMRGNQKTITMFDLQQLGQLELSNYENETIQTDAKIACLNLTCSQGDSIRISEINLTDAILAYDMVVINIPAENIAFEDGAILYYGVPIQIVPRIYPGNQLIQDLASRLIFNFPNATEINMLNYAVIGSIIAPHAAVVGAGGSLNGMLIADSLFQSGGMELHAFTISLDEQLWELTSKSFTGHVKVVKRDTLDHVGLCGAVFSLYQYNEDTQVYDLIRESLTTSADGVLIIEELPIGRYKLVETHAPTGYALPEATTTLFEIKTNDKGEIIQVNTIYIDNIRLRGSVKCLKTDFENPEIKLKGAVFSLFMYNEETYKYELVSSGLTTSADGMLIIDDLLPGDYKLVETKAPEGYYLSPNPETHFTIALDHNGEIIVLGIIDITNTKLGCVQIIKTDSEDAQITLSGAVFTLKKFDTESGEYEVIRTGLVTDEDGKLMLEDLAPGEYMLVETKAPYGYKLPDDRETLFTIEL